MKKIGYIIEVKIPTDKKRRFLCFDSQKGYHIALKKDDTPVIYNTKRDVSDVLKIYRTYNSKDYPNAKLVIIPIFS